MGSFAYYTGCMTIPEEKKPVFVEQMCRLLYLGGMMNTEEVKMFGNTLTLLKPVPPMPKTGEKDIDFFYNYFEDDPWESAGFDVEEARLWSGKVGSGEFSDVMRACYILYELYDAGYDFAQQDTDFIDTSYTIGWINHALGTRYTPGKRANIWACIEHDILKKERYYLRKSELTNLIPYSWRQAAGGTDLADLMYILEGTEDLSEEKIEEGSYPYDVLTCRRALENYFHSEDHSIEALWALLKQGFVARSQEQDEALKPIAQLTLYIPARVFVYLTAELKKLEFWKAWGQLHEEVYRDEQSRQYASDELREWRKGVWETPVPPMRTDVYLQQHGYFVFYKTPEELKGKPDYYLSDADRLYWWDGTDEVRITEETNKWLRKMAEWHREILTTVEVQQNAITAMQDFMKLLTVLLADIPFEEMFYDFLQNISQKEYAAAIELMRQIAEDKDIRKAGEVIKYRKNRESESKNVIDNEGRLQVKRIFAVLANRQLREKYFGF